MSAWNATRVAAFIATELAQQTLELSGADAAAFSQAFAAHKVDRSGHALAHLTSSQLTAMGLPVGYHSRVLSRIAQSTINFQIGLSPSTDPCSRYHAVHQAPVPGAGAPPTTRMFVDW